MNSMQKGVITVVIATIITSVMIVMTGNSTAEGNLTSMNHAAGRVESDGNVVGLSGDIKAVSPDEVKKENPLGEAPVTEAPVTPVAKHNPTVENSTKNAPAMDDNTSNKGASSVTVDKAISAATSTLPPPPPGPFFNKQNMNVGDKSSSAQFGLKQALPLKRKAPVLSAKKPLAISKPLAASKPSSPKEPEAPQAATQKSKLTAKLQAPPKPAQDVSRKDFKPLMPSMKMKERPVPVKPAMPRLDNIAVPRARPQPQPLSQPRLQQPQPPVIKAPAKRAPPVQAVAPGVLPKPVLEKPIMPVPKQMHRAIVSPELPRMPTPPQVGNKLDKYPSQPAKPLEKRHYIQGNANQRHTNPGFNALSAPSPKDGNAQQMYRYMPPSQPNYHFPIMPQWNRGYNYSYPMVPDNYPVRPNGQPDGNKQQHENHMQKNTKTMPVENRKK